MAVAYAVLRGKVVGGMRAEVVEQQVRATVPGSSSYVSNHFHILVQANGETWRCPVNVRSQDNSEVWFKIRDAFRDHPILEQLPDVPEGLTELPNRRPGLTLDYIHEPLFDRTTMRHLPKHVTGADNDVQDHLELYATQAKNEAGAIVYVFGSFWRNQQFPPDRVLNTNRGVHDVHMNQGNDTAHRRDDGVYQDGGVIFYFPQTDRYVGAFLAFNTQVWFTNDQNGHRLPGFAEGPLVGALGEPEPEPVPGEPVVSVAPVRIIAALVNPDGVDTGKETVTLFNAGPAPAVLDGWKLMDRQNKAEDLTGTRIEVNQSVTLTLSGQGVQLSNRGGAIRLIDAESTLVDVATYSKAQAESGRIIVF